MSQSPESVAAADRDATQTDRYRLGWNALSELIGQGRSFSGHEPNCCFLNTGGERFADVSAAVGLAFPDDARAVAVCDWDFDGRTDLWVTNRTAPRVRFLRNASTGAGGHWLALRLHGTTCNRDAIGARVVVTLPGGITRSKSLRAGDGFLAQSSKWLHFGLGEATAVERVTVHWPGGSAESLGPLAIDTFHDLTQGRGAAATWSPPHQSARPLAITPLPAPPPAPGMRTWLIGRLPLPPVPGLPTLPPQPTLLTLWSAQCALCRAELAEWTVHAPAMRASGLAGMLFNVDSLLGGSSEPPPAGLPFPSREATPELAEALDIVHRTFVELQQPLPVPTSFLLDRHGRLAAIYKGAVDLDTLLADVKLLDRPESEARDAAVPFPGRWASDLFPPQPHRLAGALAAAGHPDWRDQFLAAYAAQQPATAGIAQLGAALLTEGKLEAARDTFARLFKSAPDDFPAHRDAGVLLLQHNLASPACEHLRAALPGFTDDPDFRFNLALAEAACRNPEAALANFRAAAELKPEDPITWFQIGNLLHTTGRAREAIPPYRESLRLHPNWVFPANNLAWLLATDPDATLRDGAEALRLIEPVTTADGGTNPSTLATLAAALAETGAFDRAIATATQALALATRTGDQREMQSLQAALQRYQASQPTRSNP